MSATFTANVCLAEPGPQSLTVNADPCQRPAFVFLKTEDVSHTALLPAGALDRDAGQSGRRSSGPQTQGAIRSHYRAAMQPFQEREVLNVTKVAQGDEANGDQEGPPIRGPCR